MLLWIVYANFWIGKLDFFSFCYAYDCMSENDSNNSVKYSLYGIGINFLITIFIKIKSVKKNEANYIRDKIERSPVVKNKIPKFHSLYYHLISPTSV